MSHTRHAVALFLVLSSLHWLGSSLASNPLGLSNSVASKDEGPAVISRDAPINKLSQRPVLQPKETAPSQSTYTIKTPQGKECVRCSMGVEFVVRESKKSYYFNLNPSSTKASGNCQNDKSILSLGFDGGYLEFAFIKEGDLSYVRTIRGSLNAAPPCKNCPNKTYTGIMDHEKLFKAKKGQSFRCKSDMKLKLADYFSVKLVSLQIQAFDLVSGKFGKEVECWEDYNKQMIPIVVGAVAAAICLIAILTYVLVREHRNRGYEQI